MRVDASVGKLVTSGGIELLLHMIERTTIRVLSVSDGGW